LRTLRPTRMALWRRRFIVRPQAPLSRELVARDLARIWDSPRTSESRPGATRRGGGPTRAW
jgi:hypothetical protein